MIALRQIAVALPLEDSRSAASLSAALHRKQPAFCQIIDDVGQDPRCHEAHSFCTKFCALVLKRAECCARHPLPKYPASAIRELACLVVQRQDARIGKRACGYRERVNRHALSGRAFDEDDTNWLCTTISAFLLLIEGSLSRRELVR